jgi:hypothetical protein
MLDIDWNNLKPFTKDALIALEGVESFIQLKDGIRAYTQFQDILDIVITQDETPILWNRHYCYFESLVYLTIPSPISQKKQAL